MGFSKTKFGKYDFIIQDNSDRMAYIFDFLVKTKQDLLSKRRFECNLVVPIEINHVTAYTLMLTPKELFDIKKSYPSYRISYMEGEVITDLRLIIQAG